MLFFCYFCLIPQQKYYNILLKLVSISKKIQKKCRKCEFFCILGVKGKVYVATNDFITTIGLPLLLTLHYGLYVPVSVVR